MAALSSEFLAHLRHMIAGDADSDQAAILTTISPDGWPHAAWMGTASAPDHQHLFSLTSPDSAKVRHLKANPKSEWMLVDAARETVLYLRGTTRVVEDVAELKHIWQLFPDKSRALFLSFCNSSPGYAALETTIIEAEWVLPRQGQRGRLHPDDVAEPVAADFQEPPNRDMPSLVRLGDPSR